MIKVFVAQNHAEAHLVRGLLQAEGIDAEVRGDALSTLEGGLAVMGLRPSVWVHKDEGLPKAVALVARFEASSPVFGDPWHCPQCEERHEPQFTECWHCGTSRPEA